MIITRADAIEAVHKYFVGALNNEPHEIDEDGDDVFTDMKSVNALLHHNKYVSKALKELPSAELPKGELISRADALKPFCIAPDGTRIPEVDCDNFPVEFSVEFIKKHLLSLPSIEAVQGEWIHDTHCGVNLPEHKCSICGEWEYSDIESNYCPNCGARMIDSKHIMEEQRDYDIMYEPTYNIEDGSI